MIKKLLDNMCPLSKTILKIAAILPFLIITIATLFLIFTDNSYIRESYPDFLVLSVAAPAIAVIVSLLGDLVWRDR